TNIKYEHIWDVVLITSQRQLLVWKTQEISAQRSRMKDIIQKIENLIIDAQTHQINLVFGDIFKENELFKHISKDAVQIVRFFHNSTYFMGILWEEQIRICKKNISLISPGDTC
ncbi:25329_t:CDS:2, partial [Racocetra persica]